MTPYKKLLYSLSAAQEKYPESFVAVEVSSGKVIAHSKELNKVFEKTKKCKEKLAFGRKMPKNWIT